MRAIFKFIFKTKWDDGLNIIQNLFQNIYLPNSSGKPSMHTTLLVYIGAIPVFMFIMVQLYIYATTKVQPPVEFYIFMGTIATFVTGAFSYRENKSNS